MLEFQSPESEVPARQVHDDDIAFAVKTLGWDEHDGPRLIRAVDKVEAPRGGFIEDGRPELLFESHAFHQRTKGLYDGDYPNLSTPTWVHNYGAGGAHQYDRLHAAIQLDREAALSSASWGRWQIMGFNYADAGYDSVESFVADMCETEGYQLDAFVAYLQNTGLDEVLKAHEWAEFARRYNGSGQVEKYAADLEAAYNGEG